MSYTGHCNCGNVSITLPQQPKGTSVCHCTNCKRAGGGSFSLNYLVNESDMVIADPKNVLKTYEYLNPSSGNMVKRIFCSHCGSPAMTVTPKQPGKAFLKASLFDKPSPPEMGIFEERKEEWLGVTY
ncbi:hypothetical protein BO70DRAFT_377602 [Aspergillus heteromorphus CBS 117.55]|uniref:CENP-V/GFA domain-containing protein n=1 Tax=Aspergillus heteromorphus CBS 117.55 TaxID=1448321 RepID=A0A317WTQ3_9EURO|nr:uncharacterized protein BO70DRAFT_377602 [Aspergillus heteromorphus CBS 117.55]PWY89191.1 hypothetical protein BO70DRAFT_377602 [Aspergillus heteromorphus CBS 117.55]